MIANYLGSAWSALMGLAFVPLYIHYLGIEAYGLIGVFVVVQSCVAVLDAGLTPTLIREMARFKGGAYTTREIRTLANSVECVFALTALLIAVVLFLTAPWLAREWLSVNDLPIDVVSDGLRVMGLVVAIRWMSGLYRGAIIGLQHLVWLNIFTSIFSTLRGLGVLAVLIWVSPTIEAFFVYQGALFAVEGILLCVQMRTLLPESQSAARFDSASLHQVWRFAAGMTSIALLATLLTQTDKLMLSTMLPLREFGYYALASSISGALYLMIMPFSNVLRPLLSELVAIGESAAVAETYHKFAQLLTIAVVPAALVLSILSDHVLLLWTRDPTTSTAVAPLVSLLVIGTMVNGLMNTPYALQLAYGKIHIAVWTNAISVLFLLPALYFGVSQYGAIAGAAVWVVLNFAYLLIALPIMHKSLLPNEMRSWYVHDVLVPTGFAIAPVLIVFAISPTPTLERPLVSAVVLVLAGIASAASATMATPFGRRQVFRLWVLANPAR